MGKSCFCGVDDCQCDRGLGRDSGQSGHLLTQTSASRDDVAAQVEMQGQRFLVKQVQKHAASWSWCNSLSCCSSSCCSRVITMINDVGFLSSLGSVLMLVAECIPSAAMVYLTSAGFALMSLDAIVDMFINMASGKFDLGYFVRDLLGALTYGAMGVVAMPVLNAYNRFVNLLSLSGIVVSLVWSWVDACSRSAIKQATVDSVETVALAVWSVPTLADLPSAQGKPFNVVSTLLFVLIGAYFLICKVVGKKPVESRAYVSPSAGSASDTSIDYDVWV